MGASGSSSEHQAHPKGWHCVGNHVCNENDHYLWSIDEWRNGDEQFCLIHFLQKEWSLAIFKQMCAEWRLFRSIVTCPLFAVSATEDEKWHKFVQFFGFRFLMPVVLNNGEHRSMYVHTLP